jgi:hypothetical protein
MNNVKFSVTFAKWVVETAKSLVSHMYSSEYDPATGSFEETQGLLPPSMYERIPSEDVELRYWINTVLQFCKTVANVFKHELIMLENVETLDFYSELNENQNEI